MSSALSLPAFLSKTPRRNSPRSVGGGTTSATLLEALRTNPFGTDRTSSNTTLHNDDRAEDSREILNNDLLTLATLFPDVKAEVLRELLLRFDGTSRLQVCVGQLLKYRAEWVKGRWQVPPRDFDKVPLDETFRSEGYKHAVKRLLTLEFRSLSRSAVDAVLAESNSSYTNARPVLQDLSKRTWRATLGSLNIFRKKKEADVPPSFIFEKATGDSTPQLKATGSDELDEELAVLFHLPIIKQRQAQLELADRVFAETLNLKEAEEADAVYECDCCCSDTTFESMSACTEGGHIICFECTRRTVQEALFGQGWGKSIDADKGTVKCIAPLSGETCGGCLPLDLVARAINSGQSGVEIWRKFEDRLASDCLLKAQVHLIHCPFCPYAEVDPLYQVTGTPSKIHWRFRNSHHPGSSLKIILVLEMLPILFLISLVLSVFSSYLSPRHLFNTSLHNLALGARSPRFVCRSPRCSRASCLRCSKPWHDPHICHEPLLLSLRTTVEAARTAAIKRTCPRCGLSFVKASGCNKLTCVCGYAMCYLCRKSLSGDGSNGRGGVAQGEGYRHFCEHFRVNPGRPCDQCDKCDLYRAEDEDLIVRRAGEEAEREWRVKEGMVGVEGFDSVNSDAAAKNVEVGLAKWSRCITRGGLEVQTFVDWAVDQVIKIEL